MRTTRCLALVLTVLFGSVTVGTAAPATLTGCLEPGHEEGEFRLTHATGGDADHYEVVPGKGVDLKAHLGHKVEITGEKATDVEHKGAKKEAPHDHLRVTSMKHIAAKCP